jgi:hypothetical protein
LGWSPTLFGGSDRDGIFAKHLDESIGRLGVKVLKSPPRSPMANSIDERTIITFGEEVPRALHCSSVRMGAPYYNEHAPSALSPTQLVRHREHESGQRGERGQETPPYEPRQTDQRSVQHLDIEELKSVPFVPRSHPFIERLIGTLRREYLDQTFFPERPRSASQAGSIRRLFNERRVHAGLGGRTPFERYGTTASLFSTSLGDPTVPASFTRQLPRNKEFAMYTLISP